MVPGIFVLFFIIPLIFFGGIIFLIVYVVRKSTRKLSPEETRNERRQLIADMQSSLHKVEPWGSRTAADISNSAAFTAIRGIKNSLKARILDYDRKTIIVFRRIDRGLTTNSIISAGSSDFQFFYIVNESLTSIYFNNKPLGEINAAGQILDPGGTVIGSFNYPKTISVSIGVFEHRTGARSFPFELHGVDVAVFIVNSRISNLHSNAVFTTDTTSAGNFRPLKNPNSEEETWLRALVIFQLSYHGFWFTEI